MKTITKKIIFSDRKKCEIMSFSNFVFFNTDYEPQMYDSLVTINLGGIKIERKTDGIQGEFFILKEKLNKMLYEELNKFSLYIAVGEYFLITFEKKEADIISVLVQIDDCFLEGYLDFKYEYNMGKEQALSLISQVEGLYKERNNT